ncbi:hypothetical protein CXG46_00525 [Nocardioides alpinus]|uniref:SipW-cognate class signal peptide n=1 Tax=Nocardioides alpinus TaxID=748909 RepID=A0ABX4R1R4_9ACTN|nr:hypothetical protein CXG46_00525 [Nocardioides alpinus]
MAQPVAAPVAAPVTVQPHSTTSPRARVLVSAAVLLGLVGLATAFVAVGRTGDDEPGGAPGAAPIQGGWPEAGASRTTTQVGADGVLDVTHWIHATEPLDELDVALPELPDGVSIDASAVEVVADGRRASGPAMLTFSSASYAFSDATRIRVSYQLSGAVELSSSAPDRGLVTTTTLDVSPVQGTDTRVVRSEAVLSLACAPTAETSLEPCGESDADDQWTVRLTGPDVGARVVAAVTVS